MYKYLDNYSQLDGVKKMTLKELYDFSEEIRHYLIEKVSKNGGHLASNLGVVELTLSLLNIFDVEEDKIVWDVGHQSYVYKLLTGRKECFDTLRKFGGLSGFPKRCESKYDYFETGHSSTSISAALGLARARDILNEKSNVIAVIGDGALTGGMALEALNDIGYNKTNMIIVLNDNQMSISENVGGISNVLNGLRVDPNYNRIKEDITSTLNKIYFGKEIANSLGKIKDGIRNLLVPGQFFEELGIKYFGPIDGHDIKQLSKVLGQAKKIKGPVLIHALTLKGKGYDHAEENPSTFHGIGPFNLESGKIKEIKKETYSKVFGKTMVDLGKNHENLVAITAAMPDGTGLKEFSQVYKDRFFDVGIAEQHATTLAAGMASGGLKPVFAVYSTFLQRAYDQIIHDICLQKLPVILAIDRAGIVGEDGETHQGLFDLSYLTHIPNLTIMTPRCTKDLQFMLEWAIEQNEPIAIRYPRGGDNYINDIPLCLNINKGKWQTVCKGEKVVIIALGDMVNKAYALRDKLKNVGIDPTIVNALFVKPLDTVMLDYFIENDYKIITIEDNYTIGGFGAYVLNYTNNKNKNIKVLNLGYKDEFVTHGEVEILYKLNKLDENGIFKSIVSFV
ncbi:1-deoxy-D-xylulose-5-phosphate synthase [Clostridium grantii]|uniref:1-deoxy-D-xylulose-5-phosphate synthase n=1 Tax=Clostridium grantii DSM 8605 TaxID=1121316 RepID=A0A1M5SEF0_9CLOT|nr:1-deoxy-D-xylulose-5-phosphate synthase [Clostridium grantii]SHH36977.1 1-deoxy-D-xylulose-5-phosphate synthase [Clostridium grantii DSM 8605]